MYNDMTCIKLWSRCRTTINRCGAVPAPDPGGPKKQKIQKKKKHVKKNIKKNVKEPQQPIKKQKPHKRKYKRNRKCPKTQQQKKR